MPEPLAEYPVRDSRVVLSELEIEAREEAMVARLLASNEPVSVIVLGAAHDLASRLGRREVEYRRIVPSEVERLMKRLE
jgi:hypothetical protein